MCSGREFQVRAVATGKARLPSWFFALRVLPSGTLSQTLDFLLQYIDQYIDCRNVLST